MHIRHALEQGLKKIEVHIADTDVVVILVGLFYEFTTMQLFADIWIAFGIGKNFRLYGSNAICTTLGEPGSAW